MAQRVAGMMAFAASQRYERHGGALSAPLWYQMRPPRARRCPRHATPLCVQPASACSTASLPARYICPRVVAMMPCRTMPPACATCRPRALFVRPRGVPMSRHVLPYANAVVVCCARRLFSRRYVIRAQRHALVRLLFAHVTLPRRPAVWCGVKVRCVCAVRGVQKR